jgi:hypothetical protein
MHLFFRILKLITSIQIQLIIWRSSSLNFLIQLAAQKMKSFHTF